MQDVHVADDASGRIAGVEAFAGPPVVKRDMRFAGTLLPPACVNLLLCTNENARIIFGLPLGQTCQSTGQIRGRSVTSLKGPSNAGIAEAELQARKRPVAGRSGGDGIMFPLPIWLPPGLRRIPTPMAPGAPACIPNCRTQFRKKRFQDSQAHPSG